MAQKRTTNEDHIFQTNRLENASKIPFPRGIEKRRTGKFSSKNADSSSKKSRKHIFDMNDDAATEAMLEESQHLAEVEVGQKSASKTTSKVLHEETFSQLASEFSES